MVGKGLISGAGEAFERMPEQSERDREREIRCGAGWRQACQTKGRELEKISTNVY